MNLSQDRIFKARDYSLSLGHKTLVMGILNVTPDSFSDGGELKSVDEAVTRAMSMIECGADIIDIGGESSRPFSEPVSLEEELQRVIPVIEALAPKIHIPISIDTYKSEVANKAITAGASIVNDISAGMFDSEMAHVCGELKAGVILMHIQGTPRQMQVNPHYDDLLGEIKQFLLAGKERFMKASVSVESIVVDPGIGFGKTLEHNLTIMKNLKVFQEIGSGVLVGASRKLMIGALTGRAVKERVSGSLGAAICSSFYGADIVRVHDVLETVEALKIANAIRSA